MKRIGSAFLFATVMAGAGAACGNSSTTLEDAPTEPTTSDGDPNDGDPNDSGAGSPRDEADASTSDGGSTLEDASSPPTLPLGEPITAPPSTWTWVDVPGAVCDDGTPTGIGVWPSPTSKKLLFFFAGGGACWDYETCVKKSTSTHGPFGAKEFGDSVGAFGGWIIGHGDANPFKDWTTVFVPYCTSDLHAGDLVKTYTDGTDSKDLHHKGRVNVAAYLARLAATFPDVDQVGVSGSSAGGAGALFSYPAVRAYWPNAQGFLVDDSLPFFKDDIPASIRKAWFESWNLEPLTTPICGASCMDDMPQLFSGMAARYPNDRMGLISYTTDYVLAGYYEIDWTKYWKILGQFTKTTLEPTANFKHYYVDAWGHVTLTNMGSYNVNGTKLTTWLTQMTSGDPAWTSVP